VHEGSECHTHVALTTFAAPLSLQNQIITKEICNLEK
jgi:hypothetical protein